MKNTEDKYLEKISDEDIDCLTEFQESFIIDLTAMINEYYKISDEVMSEYLRLKDKISSFTYNNETIKMLEQDRLESYLQKDKEISIGLINAEQFLKELNTNEDTQNWLFKLYQGEYSNLKDDLFLQLINIFREEFLYKQFIEITFKSIAINDYMNFYSGFYHILNNGFDIPHLRMHKYSIILTKLLFDKDIGRKEKPHKVKIDYSVFGYLTKYLRKN